MSISIKAASLTSEAIGRTVSVKTDEGAIIEDELTSIFIGIEQSPAKIMARFKNVEPARSWERGGQVLGSYFTISLDALVIVHEPDAKG